LWVPDTARVGHKGLVVKLGSLNRTTRKKHRGPTTSKRVNGTWKK